MVRNYMKNMIFLFVVLLLGTLLYAHRPILGRASYYLSQADAIATAVVTKISLEDKKCSILTKITLKNVVVLKGRFDKKFPILYRYTDFVWRRGCPSVHYRYAPRASKMKKNSKIIVSLKYQKKAGRYEVTSSYNMNQLKEVTETFLRKRSLR